MTTSAPPFVYRACGLTLASSFPIDGLLHSAGEADYQVRLAPVADTDFADATTTASGSLLRISSDSIAIRFPDATAIRIDNVARRIDVDAPAGATAEDTATYLTGPMLALLCRAAGRVALHAAAVVVDGRAVLLCGLSEAGKSTAAAAFARDGFDVLSDDVCAIDDAGETLLVLPAAPRVRLWPDSAALLYGEANALPPLTPTWGKLYLDLLDPPRFARAPVPAGALYLLGSGEAGVTAMRGAEAIALLVGSSFFPECASVESRRRDFEVASRFVAQAPVARIPARLAPDELVARVVDDVRAKASGR
jgi:hypothetical protein